MYNTILLTVINKEFFFISRTFHCVTFLGCTYGSTLRMFQCIIHAHFFLDAQNMKYKFNRNNNYSNMIYNVQQMFIVRQKTYVFMVEILLNS